VKRNHPNLQAANTRDGGASRKAVAANVPVAVLRWARTPELARTRGVFLWGSGATLEASGGGVVDVRSVLWAAGRGLGSLSNHNHGSFYSRFGVADCRIGSAALEAVGAVVIVAVSCWARSPESLWTSADERVVLTAPNKTTLLGVIDVPSTGGTLRYGSGCDGRDSW
jgi:hypothetical protein